MRQFLISVLVTICVFTSAYADNLQPGDKKYQHDEMHPHYQKLFSNGKCNCHTGECRPTRYRTSKASPSGIQVILNRKWINVPPEAIQRRESVPPELWQDPAHICAFYVNGKLKVECAIINSGV